MLWLCSTTHYAFKNKWKLEKRLCCACRWRKLYPGTLVSSSFFSGVLLFSESAHTGSQPHCHQQLLAAWCTLRCWVAPEMGCAPPHLTTPWLVLPQFLPNGYMCSSGALPWIPRFVQKFALRVIRRTECFCSGGVSFLGLRVFNENFRLWMCHPLITAPYCVASCWSKVV